MLDLYLIFTPIYAALAGLSLLTLKSALSQNTALGQYRPNTPKTQAEQSKQQETTPLAHTAKHLLLNLTPIQMCAVRQPSHKISLLLSISIIAFATLLEPSPFAFAPLGIVVFFTYFFVKMAITTTEEQPSLIDREKYQQIIFTCLTLALDFAMIGITYKNYHNSTLASSGIALAISLALDNFALRPIAVLILSLPLSKSQAVQVFITQNEKIQIMLEALQKADDKQMLQNPGKGLSPSKIPKRIPLNLQIQPIPVNDVEKPSQQKLINSLDILRKIKKEKMLDPILKTTNKNQQVLECSLNYLLESTNKPEREQSFILEPQNLLEKISQIQEEIPFKPSKGQSEHLIVVNPSHQERILNEEEISSQKFSKKEPRQITEESQPDKTYSIETIQANVDTEVDTGQISIVLQPQTPLNSEEPQPLKITLMDFEKLSKNQPLRICLNGQRMVSQQNENNQMDLSIPHKKKQILEVEVEEQNYRSGDGNHRNTTIGVLQIKRQNTPGDDMAIEEVDFNSPSKNKHNISKGIMEAESKLTAKKKKKKHSHDQRNRVIKFSTGEPYLQYLPNLLNKDSKGKKSQALSRKQMLIDERVINSVKRPGKKRVGRADNDENIVPTFRIQQL